MEVLSSLKNLNNNELPLDKLLEALAKVTNFNFVTPKIRKYFKVGIGTGCKNWEKVYKYS